jgi:hypothetical protein
MSEILNLELPEYWSYPITGNDRTISFRKKPHLNFPFGKGKDENIDPDIFLLIKI